MLVPLFGLKLSSFWVAPSAGGADAQCSAFVHVEISHPEELRHVLPRAANIFSLCTALPSICPVISPFFVVADLSQL